MIFERELWATLAAIGAALFVVSDAALAAGRFGHPMEWGRSFVLGTYFAAQAGLALSVGCYGGFCSRAQ